MAKEKTTSTKAKTNPGQIKIPIKMIRFPQSFDAPVGFKAGSSLEACSSERPSNRHTLDFYPENAIIRVTWYPPRKEPVSFLVPSGHSYFMAEFSGDDTPRTPKD